LPENVTNVRKEGDRYAVRWTEGGRARRFSRARAEDVETKRHSLLAAAGTGSESEVAGYLPPLPDGFDGGPAAIKTALVEAWCAANRAARAGSSKALDVIRKYASTADEIAHAIVPHAGYLDMEIQFNKQLQFIEGLARKRSDATQPSASACINNTLAGRTRPATPVH
jgi:hypothetical protein